MVDIGFGHKHSVICLSPLMQDTIILELSDEIFNLERELRGKYGMLPIDDKVRIQKNVDLMKHFVNALHTIPNCDKDI